MPIEVSESLIRAITTKDKALSDGRTLVKKGAFSKLGKLADDSLLWGLCQGSGAKPYEISVDLVGDNPTLRCSCPVKPPPCKHILGMLVQFLEKAAAFEVGEPAAALLEKRAKNVERADKKAETAARPKEVNTAALEKKTKTQREALDLLEKLVVDIAASGLGTLDTKKANRIAEQAKQMNDAYLPGAAEALRRLAALCAMREDDDRFWGAREPGSDLPDELRQKLMIRHLTRLWAMIRRGQKALDDKLEEGESASDGDAVVEDLLGRVWDLASLKAAGYWKQGLDLFELADERYNDTVRQERIEQGWLLDLADGSVYVDRKYRPLGALDKVGEKPSYDQPLTIDDAGVYPGFVNRRVRWELKGYHERKAATAADFDKLHRVALATVEGAVARYKEQIKNPLAPDEAVLLLRVADIQRTIPDSLVAIDDKGGKLVLRDSPITRYRSTNNLEMAAGASLSGAKLRGPASLLVRLYLGLEDGAIYGQPMALVTGATFARLCM